jgi:peptidoglycan/xylan/chitin deacetylase (PgdA/CDA1 family)
MAGLHEKGFLTLGLVEAADRLREGAPWPARSLVITFDDGYQSVYEEAFPVLDRYGMRATVFLAVGQEASSEPSGRLPSLLGRPMLSWSEIREMHSAGISFGAHTLTHPDLTEAAESRLEVEICQSKAMIEDALSTLVASFAYPYGRFDQASLAIVRQNFACACSDKLGLVGPGSDPHILERVDAYYLRSDWLFDLVATPLFPFYVGARSIPRAVRRSLQSRVG